MNEETPRCGLCGRDPSWKGLIRDRRQDYKCLSCGAGWPEDSPEPGGFPDCLSCVGMALLNQLDAMNARLSTLQYYADELDRLNRCEGGPGFQSMAATGLVQRVKGVLSRDVSEAKSQAREVQQHIDTEDAVQGALEL